MTEYKTTNASSAQHSKPPYSGPNIIIISYGVCEKYFITIKIHESSCINGKTSVSVLITLQ